MSTITIAPPMCRSQQRKPQVRLTRRGRLVVFLLAFGLVVGAAVALAAGSVATRKQGAAPEVEVITVAPGDTLWDIASDAAAGGDVRDMMQRIEELNAIDASLVYVGQELRVPSN